VVRRWVFAVAGFTVGLAAVGSVHMEAINEWLDAETQTEQLRHELQALQATDSRGSGVLTGLGAPSGPPKALALWPSQDTQFLIWPQLQIMLARHGVQLLSLRPASISQGGAWSSQAVTLQMRARFDDWVQAWAAMNARGPVWSIDRLRMTPLDTGVAIEAVLRVWLLDSSKTHKPAPVSQQAQNMPGVIGPREGLASGITVKTQKLFVDDSARRVGLGFAGSSRAASAGASGAPVFVQTSLVNQPGPAGGATKGDVQPMSGGVALVPGADALMARPSIQAGDARLASFGVFSSEPDSWPLDQVRMAGVWQHAREKKVILVAGPHWVGVHEGQRIGPQGHVVVGIQAQEVRLRAAQGPEHVIRLEKAAP
jgi:hypothetical protein